MRVGNSTSASYRKLKARQRFEKIKLAEHWAERLDSLVEQAESFGPKTAQRRILLGRADKVREKLRKVDH